MVHFSLIPTRGRGGGERSGVLADKKTFLKPTVVAWTRRGEKKEERKGKGARRASRPQENSHPVFSFLGHAIGHHRERKGEKREKKGRRVKAKIRTSRRGGGEGGG